VLIRKATLSHETKVAEMQSWGGLHLDEILIEGSLKPSVVLGVIRTPLDQPIASMTWPAGKCSTFPAAAAIEFEVETVNAFCQALHDSRAS
jgi:hypothetical protein